MTVPTLNRTHDPARRSWIESANLAEADFPIQHLPYGVVARGDARHVGVAIGDAILDLTLLEEAGLLRPAGDRSVFADGVLNPLMSLPRAAWRETREAIADLLDADAPTLRDNTALRERVLIERAGARLHLPFFVRSFTDFYASLNHATNVGTMFRGPDKALMPNWPHLPVGYNGRASTVVVSGTPVVRPLGQVKGAEDAAPSFVPSGKLDFELELGAIVGTPSAMGQRVTTAEAWDMIFGYVLLNDWSARDIQLWEYQPLGPFQSKAFATSISPWIVTAEALEPFRVGTPERIAPLLPYLHEDTPNNFDIDLEITLAPGGQDPLTVSRTNYETMYFSAAQQLAHHASSGCAMCTGDLIGSGTISGSGEGSAGSLLELTWNGRDPLRLGEQMRTFLEDGDSVILSGRCDGAYRVGFGTCEGTIMPAAAVDVGP